MDRNWWEQYLPEVRLTFVGKLFSNNDFKSMGIEQAEKPFNSCGNSGAGAIALAGKAGASRVLMLGYDCQYTDGAKHWHGDHPKGFGNAGRIENWPNKFAKLKASLPGVEIINCSRATALTCFPRMDLESALCP